jgi:hypothetical protein
LLLRLRAVGTPQLLAHLEERIRLQQRRVGWLSRRDDSSPVVVSDFRLVGGLPVWRYTFDEVVLEKRLFMPNEQNSIFVTYTLVKAAETIRFGLRPMVAIRMHEAPVDRNVPQEPVLVAHQRCLEVNAGEAVPTIRLAIRDHASAFTVETVTESLHYELEEQRGCAADGGTWSPATTKSISPNTSRSPSSLRQSASASSTPCRRMRRGRPNSTAARACSSPPAIRIRRA